MNEGKEAFKLQLSEIKLNPSNPRLIKDDKFKKLVKSIQEFPKMLELRPIIVDENNIVLGGNMRLAALKHLQYDEIPENWVKRVNDLSAEQKKQFLIKDNIQSGAWDWDDLANEWDPEQLIDWGFDPWNFGEIEFEAKTPTVQQNIDELAKIREQRSKGNDGMKEKNDTEKYLVIVFQSREEKAALLKELDLPEDERYIPSGGVQIIPSGKWISKFKSAAKNKAGAAG